MSFEFKVTRRVEFSDTDMAGIMHYSNFFRFMETAEHAYFRSLGFSVLMDHLEPPLGWPRVHAECDYKRPLRFEDEVEIQLLVKEVRTKTISYEFRFRKIGEAAVLAKGLVTVACVTRDGHGKLIACPIPGWITEKITTAPTEMFA